MIHHDILSQMDRDSIAGFLEQNLQYLTGDVFDFGCGRMPYKDMIEQGGGSYWGYDRTYFPASTTIKECGIDFYSAGKMWDAILCTQVIQYIPDPLTVLRTFREFLKSTGKLVMTYPTNWNEVEYTDLFRYTKNGMERLLYGTGFKIVSHEPRWFLPEIDWVVGYGVVASVL